jgi:DNA-directed RNA polymerase subunit RPC12/RpoP
MSRKHRFFECTACGKDFTTETPPARCTACGGRMIKALPRRASWQRIQARIKAEGQQ